MKPAPHRQSIRLIFGIAVTGFFVWLILRSVEMENLVQALSQARPGWIAAAFGFLLAGYACRITRWRIMLRHDNPDIGWMICAVPYMGSIAANNVLPFRAGDALRALAFSGWLGVPTPAIIATLLVERLLDLISLLIALGLVLLIFDLGSGASGALVGLSGTGLIGIGLAVMAMLLFPQMVKPLVQLLLQLVSGLSAGLGLRLRGMSDKIFGTLRHLARGPRMALLVMWSAAVWTLEGAVFWASAQAIPSLSAPLAAWLALPVGTLSTLLPSTPGYIGTFHFFVIKAMEVLQNPPVAAAAFAVLVHLVFWLPVTLIGSSCLAYWVLVRRPSSNFPIQKEP